MKIGELSRRTGISQRMLRYYEEQGLLSPARISSGYREYGNEEIWMLDKIQVLQRAGLTLNVIRDLVPCIIDEPVKLDPCPRILSTLKSEMEKLQGRIKDLSESRDVLEKYLRETENRKHSPAPDIDGAARTRRDATQTAQTVRTS